MKYKPYIYIIVLSALLVLSIALSLWRVSVLNGEVRRLKSGWDAELMQQLDVQQTVTRRELKDWFDGYVSELRNYGVRTANVENIVNVEYRYRDTTIVREQVVFVYDTIREVYCQTFDVGTECYRIVGSVCDSTVTILEHDVYDDLLLSLYRERRRCLFEPVKVKAIAISKCKGDTLKVLRNISLEKTRWK